MDAVYFKDVDTNDPILIRKDAIIALSQRGFSTCNLLLSNGRNVVVQGTMEEVINLSAFRPVNSPET